VTDAALAGVEIGRYSLVVATRFGPRILGLKWDRGPELFARLSDEIGIEHPDAGRYRFRGGHRLWAAPEIPRITYANDDHTCEVTPRPSSYTVKAPADAAGLVKELGVSGDGSRLVVEHRLANFGAAPISVAPWAITQFPLGGVAILPLGRPSTSDVYQADRSVVLWPYTNLADRRVSWLEAAALIDAMAGPRFKIGSGPRAARLGYLKGGYLFSKEIPAAGTGQYPDRGAVAQVFVDDKFCELESVGPITALAPGSSVSHREIWEVTGCADLPAACRHLLREEIP
jgi:hypothetical protein